VKDDKRKVWSVERDAGLNPVRSRMDTFVSAYDLLSRIA